MRCYVLGAGFSKTCGLPLASELTRLVFEHVQQGQQDFRSDMPEAWLRLLKNLYPGWDCQERWPDFEDLITVLDEWERSREAYDGPRQDADPYSPAHLKGVLLRHLRILLCELTASRPADQWDLVKGFVAAAARCGEAVVSFNWDVLLEIACRELGIGISYGGRVTDGLQAAKPHGSLNLAQMNSEAWERARGAFNVRDVFIDYEAGDFVAVRAEDPADALNRTVSPFPFSLVEPTARKMYDSPWLDLQWRRALDMLRQSGEIIIIGYSLPPLDFRPRVLFQAAVVDREPQVRLVAPDADDLARKNYQPYIRVRVEPEAMFWQEWFARQA